MPFFFIFQIKVLQFTRFRQFFSEKKLDKFEPSFSEKLLGRSKAFYVIFVPLLFVFVWFVFTFSCLQEGSCLVYVICICLVLLYLQLFVGGLMSCLCYLYLFGSSLPPVVCRRAHVLFTLFVFVWFFFTSCCLQEGSCLVYVICICLVRLYLQLFVGGLMSCFRYLYLFGSSLPLVVCRRAHVLFMGQKL